MEANDYQSLKCNNSFRPLENAFLKLILKNGFPMESNCLIKYNMVEWVSKDV